MNKSLKVLSFSKVPFIIVILCIFWRVSIFVISFLGSKFFTYTPTFPYSDIFLKPSGLPEYIWTFGNFDGVHYLNIALHGYNAQFTQAFFPVYPLVIRFLNIIFPFSPIITALSISFIFFVLTTIMFYKLLRLDYDHKISLWAIGFMLTFPTAVYFGSIYTESLFLFLVLSSLYFARKDRWFFAIFFAAISTATRIVGIALLPALLLEWYFLYKDKSIVLIMIRNYFFNKKKLYTKKIKIGKAEIVFLSCFFSLSGLFLYMGYLQKEYHDSMYFWHAQGVFGAQRSGSAFILLPQVIVRYFRILTTVSPNLEIYWVAFNEVLMSLMTIVILLISFFKKIRLSYIIFSLIAFIMPTFTGTLSSMPRYIMILFPIYIVLALTKNRYVKWLMIYLSSILLFIFTILFTRGHWVS